MKLPKPVTGSRPARRYAVLGVGLATLVSSAAIAGLASTAHAASGPIDVILAVGSDQTQRVVSWYTQSGSQQKIVFEQGTKLDKKATTIAATTAANIAADVSADPLDPTTGARLTPAPVKQSGYSNAHATLTGLKASTTYTYKVGDDSAFSKTYTFKTGASGSAWTFDFFGDPQIGSSQYTPSDGAGWAATLDYAAAHDNPDLLVSGGDQVEVANDEYQWTTFIDGDVQDPAYQTEVLKQIPWAETIGNHDVGAYNYQQHFFPPNLTTDSALYTGSPTSVSGGDYYFIYNNVLFIDINSNAYAGTPNADDAHVAYVTKVVNEVGSKAKWKVLVYHHSIYSPADHANDSDNIARRPAFTKAFSDLGVNLVLQGHDHSYSRSYALQNDGTGAAKADPAEQPNETQITTGPGGVVYVTANSASGSKYYNLTTPTGASGYVADTQFPSPNNVGQPRHWPNSVEDQEHVQTYVKVDVNNGELKVTDVRANDNLGPNSAVDFTNNANYTPWTGVPTNLSAPAAPGTGLWPGNPFQQAISPNPLGGVGSAVDSYTLHQNAAWTASTVYNAGDEVSYHGHEFQAQWYSQNQAPGDPYGPWAELAYNPDGSQVWTASAIFNTGNKVTYQGSTWEALWYTRDQVPGDPYGPWQQLVTNPDGTAVWTATRIFNSGDKATYKGHVYQAQWYTRNQAPGDQYGPWKLIS